MDILKIAIDWAKAELVSTSFFILCGIIFLSLSLGLWQFGKTDLAKGYIFPMLIAGIFLMTVGVGLFLPINRESFNLKSIIMMNLFHLSIQNYNE